MSAPFVTASAMERVIECPASAVLPQTQSSSKYSVRGNSVHKEMEELCLGLKDKTSFGATREAMQLPDDNTPELCFSFDCVSGEAKEVGRIRNRDYPMAPFSTIYGTADLVGSGYVNTVTSVDIIDWKTNFEMPSPRSWQMRTLAFMAARARGLKYARTRITHIRDEIVHSEWALWTEDDFNDTEIRLKRLYDTVNKLGWKEGIGLEDIKFGPHCHFCPAYLSCPYPRSLLAAHGTMGTIGSVTPVDASNAYATWQAIRTLEGRLEEAVKGYASREPIHIGNGYLYGRKEGGGAYRKFKMYTGDNE